MGELKCDSEEVVYQRKVSLYSYYREGYGTNIRWTLAPLSVQARETHIGSAGESPS